MRTRPRPSTPIAFPGCPHPTDLDVLYSQLPALDTGLAEEDIADLRDLHSDLIKICAKAEDRGIRVIIDAEHRFVDDIGTVLAS